MRRYLPLALFTTAYWLIGLAICLAQRNYEFLAYVIQMGVIVALVAWANRRARFTMPILWMLSLWGLLHLCGGIVPVPPEHAQVNDKDQTHAVLYGYWFIRDWFKYDNLVHAFGFFTTTLACAQALRPFLGPRMKPRLALFVIIATSGMGMGAINEIIEFIATLIAPETGVGDYRNNALDLCWNAVGALAAAGVYIRAAAKEPVA